MADRWMRRSSSRQSPYRAASDPKGISGRFPGVLGRKMPLAGMDPTKGNPRHKHLGSVRSGHLRMLTHSNKGWPESFYMMNMSLVQEKLVNGPQQRSS